MALKRKRVIEMLKEGYSQREICLALHCSKRDVSKLSRFLKSNDIEEDQLAELSEDELRQLARPGSESDEHYVKPDLDYICGELKKPGVTRKLLWYEYGNTTPACGMELYRYSQFCKLIEGHLNTECATMHIKHDPGRCLFVDWAGDTMALRDRITGKDIKVYLFVAALPYSGYTFAEGFTDTAQRSWLSAHEDAFAFIGGVPYIIVADNCATAVDRAPIYLTRVNSSYLDFSEHYSTAVIPARVRKPRDKAQVEGSVALCEKWVIAALRNRTFFSLDELNEAVLEQVMWLNDRPFKSKCGSRLSVFLEEEQCELKALPPERYEHFEQKVAKVSPDYHVQVDYMRYSVSYKLIKCEVDIRLSDSLVRIYHAGSLIAEHKRLYGRKGQFSTLLEHMAPNHAHYNSVWSPERFTKWAKRIGPGTEAVIAAHMASKPIIEQSFVACANILHLADRGRPGLLEAACARVATNSPSPAVSYSQLRNLMEAIKKVGGVMQADSDGADTNTGDEPSPSIGRTRGADYYHRDKGGQQCL